MRVLVCGDRKWADRHRIRWELETLPPDTVVIEGEARGADTLGREVAEVLGFKVERYPANWEKFGRAAGPIRNQQMLTEGKPDLVIAFHDHIRESKGTADMIRLAVKEGIATKLIGGVK